MTWNVIQSASGNANGPAFVTVTYPSVVSASTKLIAYVVLSHPAGTVCVSVKDAALNPMTQIVQPSVGGIAYGTVSVWAMDTPAGDVGTQPVITATANSGCDNISLVVTEVSGLAGGNTLAAMIDGTAATLAGTGNTSASTAAYSSSAAGEFLLAFYGDDGGSTGVTWTAPSGFTADANGINSSIACDVCPCYASSAGGAEAASWTLSNGTAGTENATILVAFNLAPPAFPPLAQNVDPPPKTPWWFPRAPGMPAGTPFRRWPEPAVTETPSAPATYQSAVLPDGPSLLWMLQEASGTTAADSTANGNIGRYSGGFTQSAAGPPYIQARATTFNGTTGLVSQATPGAAPGVFTLETWFRTTTSAGAAFLGFSDIQSPDATHDRMLYMDASGNVGFYVYSGTTGWNVVSSSGAYNDGQWHYAAATYSSVTGFLILYVDGTQKAVLGGATPAGANYTGYWLAGADFNDTNGGPVLGSSFFAGTLCAVAVYPVALTSAQVTTHWNAGRGPDVLPALGPGHAPVPKGWFPRAPGMPGGVPFQQWPEATGLEWLPPAAPAGWSVLQSAGGLGSGASTVQTYTSNVSAGTKLIAYFSAFSATNITMNSVKDGAGNTFTQVAWLWSATSGTGAGIFAMDTPAGDVGTKPVITALLSNGSFGAMVIQEVSGLAVGNTLAAMVDGTAAETAFAAGASHAQPAYSSAAANEFLVSFCGDQGGPQTMTQPAGYTLDAHAVNNNASADCCPAYKNSTGAAESGTWSYSGSTVGSDIAVVAFQLAGGISAGTATAAASCTATAVAVQDAGTLTTAAGAASVTAAATVIAGAATAGAGVVTAVATQVAGSAAAGAGSVSDVATQAAAASSAGAGSVTDVATQIVTGTAAGAGAVTAKAAQAATASAAGAGSVTDAVTQIATATAAGAGSVTAAGAVSGSSTASAAGAGSVAAVVTQIAPATAAGAAAVTAVVTQAATAAAAGAGAASAAATQAVTSAAAGAASVTDTVTQIAIGSAAGAGSVTAAGSVTGAGATATAAGASTVTAVATQIAPAAGTGAGSVADVATQAAKATAAGAGSVTAAGQITGTANVAGAGTAAAKAVQAAPAAVAAAAVLSALAAQRATAVLTAAGAVTATATSTAPVTYGTARQGTLAIPAALAGLAAAAHAETGTGGAAAAYGPAYTPAYGSPSWHAQDGQAGVPEAQAGQMALARAQ